MTFEPFLQTSFVGDNLTEILASTMNRFSYNMRRLNLDKYEIADQQRNEQAIVVFEVLQRNFSQEWLKETISTVGLLNHYETGFTMVHLATQLHLYRLVNEIFID